ncbi:hypothetical protein ACWCPX_22160 [Streptomyces olivaceoviridis]
MSAEVRIEPGRIARFLRLRGGRVERKLRERTERVARIAAAEAPGSVGRYIDWEIQQGPRGLEGVIHSRHPATLFILLGTRPHLITPRRRNGVLRFEVDGRVVFTRRVRHPGTRPNDYLGRAMRLGR